MFRKDYSAPWARVAELRLEVNYVFSPNQDNNETPVDDGSDNF